MLRCWAKSRFDSGAVLTPPLSMRGGGRHFTLPVSDMQTTWPGLALHCILATRSRPICHVTRSMCAIMRLLIVWGADAALGPLLARRLATHGHSNQRRRERERERGRVGESTRPAAIPACPVAGRAHVPLSGVGASERSMVGDCMSVCESNSVTWPRHPQRALGCHAKLCAGDSTARSGGATPHSDRRGRYCTPTVCTDLTWTCTRPLLAPARLVDSAPLWRLCLVSWPFAVRVRPSRAHARAQVAAGRPSPESCSTRKGPRGRSAPPHVEPHISYAPPYKPPPRPLRPAKQAKPCRPVRRLQRARHRARAAHLATGRLPDHPAAPAQHNQPPRAAQPLHRHPRAPAPAPSPAPARPGRRLPGAMGAAAIRQTAGRAHEGGATPAARPRETARQRPGVQR